MQKLILFALVGFFAQLIDGSLGMGFGATSSSLLLTVGVAPAITSATIHISQLATTAASGISHWKFDNIDTGLMLRLALPGAITAFLGTAVVSNSNSDFIKPFISTFLLTMGIYILYQFLFKKQLHINFNKRKPTSYFLIPLGAIAGFLDSIGGGGWGPVNTPLLLSRKSIEPRKIIGTVSTSEFIVTVSASIGFFMFLGLGQISWQLVVALGFSGVVAAPFAAWLVKVIPVHILAVFAGGLIIFTNGSILLENFVQNEFYINFAKSIIILTWIALITFAVYRNRKFSLKGKHKGANKVKQIHQ